MSETQTNPAIIVQPSDTLSRRAVIPGPEGIDYEAIERAEQALSELSSNFESWMADEIKALAAAKSAMAKNGVNKDTVKAMFLTAHDMKGQAATLGFPLAGSIAASLCKLTLEAPRPARIPQFLIYQHVDAIRAIVNEGVRDADNKTACLLISRLTTVTNEFLDIEKSKVDMPTTDDN